MKVLVKEYKKLGTYLLFNPVDKSDEILLTEIAGGECIKGSFLAVPLGFVLSALSEQFEGE